MRRHHLVITILAIGGGLVLPACRDDGAAPPVASARAVREFLVTGIVRQPVHDGQIVIEHEAIAGFMPAMTMPFYVADGKAAAGLAAGDRVRFRFVVGDTSRADRFEVVGREEPRVTSAAAASAESGIKRLKRGDIVPDFALVDHVGQPVSAAQLDDRLTLVTFIFTRCPVPEFCPTIMTRFTALQTRVKENAAMRARVRLVGISLDPEFDRPEILREYAEAIGVDSDMWRLATGDACCVERVTQAFSVHAENRAGTLDHTLCTALIGPDRRVIEIWRGNGWTVDEIGGAIAAAVSSL